MLLVVFCFGCHYGDALHQNGYPMPLNREKDILYGILTVKPSECGAFGWQIAIWCQLGAMLATEPRLKQKVLCGP